MLESRKKDNHDESGIIFYQFVTFIIAVNLLRIYEIEKNIRYSILLSIITSMSALLLSSRKILKQNRGGYYVLFSVFICFISVILIDSESLRILEVIESITLIYSVSFYLSFKHLINEKLKLRDKLLFLIGLIFVITIIRLYNN